MWIRAQDGVLFNTDKLEGIAKDGNSFREIDGKIETQWKIEGWLGETTYNIWSCKTEEEITEKMNKIDAALRWGARYVDLENGSIFGMEV